MLPHEELKSSWTKLNDEIKHWWDKDLRVANESEIRNDPQKNLLYLPFPYIPAGGNDSPFQEMYCWDTHFINMALLEHGRYELVRNHIINQLFMIERYGLVLTGNRDYYFTRSQVPLLAESIWNYYQVKPDRQILCKAYPLLEHEYTNYWNAEHHQTPTGLATNRDLGDPNWRPELAAEAELTDFTACFDGDIRKCNPLMTNCALVQYANRLSNIAEVLGWHKEAERWKQDAINRANLIRKYCWDENENFFLEYNYVDKVRLPYLSLGAFWTLWANVASKEQAKKMIEKLKRFEHEYGLSVTSEFYPSPHPEFKWIQFSYPSGWPPMHIMPVQGLDNYGYHEDADRIILKLLSLMVTIYHETGELWEKYNVVEGNLNLPIERYQTLPLHGFISASFVILGKRIFG